MTIFMILAVAGTWALIGYYSWPDSSIEPVSAVSNQKATGNLEIEFNLDKNGAAVIRFINKGSRIAELYDDSSRTSLTMVIVGPGGKSHAVPLGPRNEKISRYSVIELLPGTIYERRIVVLDHIRSYSEAIKAYVTYQPGNINKRLELPNPLKSNTVQWSVKEVTKQDQPEEITNE